MISKYAMLQIMKAFSYRAKHLHTMCIMSFQIQMPGGQLILQEFLSRTGPVAVSSLYPSVKMSFYFIAIFDIVLCPFIYLCLSEKKVFALVSFSSVLVLLKDHHSNHCSWSWTAPAWWWHQTSSGLLRSYRSPRSLVSILPNFSRLLLVTRICV